MAPESQSIHQSFLGSAVNTVDRCLLYLAAAERKRTKYSDKNCIWLIDISFISIGDGGGSKGRE